MLPSQSVERMARRPRVAVRPRLERGKVECVVIEYYGTWAGVAVAVTAVAAVCSVWISRSWCRLLVVSGVFALSATPLPFFAPGGGGFYPAALLLVAFARDADPELVPLFCLALVLIAGVWIGTFTLLTVGVAVHARYVRRYRIWESILSLARRVAARSGLCWFFSRDRFRELWRCPDCLVFNEPGKLECPCGWQPKHRR